MAFMGPLGAIIGRLLAQGDYDTAKRLNDEAMGAYDDIVLPALERVDPTMLGPSAMEGVQTDAAGREAQLQALDMMGRYTSGAPMVEDRAQAEAIAEPVNVRLQGALGALRSRYRGMGRGGSAGELAAGVRAASDAANSARSSQTALQAMAANRALQAASGMGSLGGAMRGQTFEEGAARAGAKDHIAQWNAAAANQAKHFNAGLGQQNFQNAMGLAGAKSGAKGRGAGFYQGLGDSTVATGGAIGAGVDQGFNDLAKGAAMMAGAAAGVPPVGAAGGGGAQAPQSAGYGYPAMDQMQKRRYG